MGLRRYACHELFKEKAESDRAEVRKTDSAGNSGKYWEADGLVVSLRLRTGNCYQNQLPAERTHDKLRLSDKARGFRQKPAGADLC